MPEVDVRLPESRRCSIPLEEQLFIGASIVPGARTPRAAPPDLGGDAACSCQRESELSCETSTEIWRRAWSLAEEHDAGSPPSLQDAASDEFDRRRGLRCNAADRRGWERKRPEIARLPYFKPLDQKRGIKGGSLVATDEGKPSLPIVATISTAPCRDWSRKSSSSPSILLILRMDGIAWQEWNFLSH